MPVEARDAARLSMELSRRVVSSAAAAGKVGDSFSVDTLRP